MAVFRRIHDRLLHHHRLVTPAQVHVPPSLPSDDDLRLVHDAEYLAAFNTGTLDDARTRRIGFGDVTRSPVLIERTKAEVAGTLLTAQLALRYGLAVNTAGGTHHAFPSFGSGFCLLNDLAVTAFHLLRHQPQRVRRVLILDLDVHQGDGTAVCCAADPARIFTLSVHAESNFPARKQRSSLDVGLPDGTADAEYLPTVSDVLVDVLRRFRPDIVLYDAGVDVHVDDALGRLAISDEGLMRRELMVLDTCLGQGVPVAGYVGGGYSADLDVLADRHICLHRAALQMWDDYCY